MKFTIPFALGIASLGLVGCGAEEPSVSKCTGSKCDSLDGPELAAAPAPGQCVFTRFAGNEDDVPCEGDGYADPNRYSAADGQQVQFTCFSTSMGNGWFMSNAAGEDACAGAGANVDISEDFSAQFVANYHDDNLQEWVAVMMPGEGNNAIGEYDADWAPAASEWGGQVGIDITGNDNMSIRAKDGELKIRRQMPSDLAGKRIGLFFDVLGDPTQDDKWWFADGDLWFDIRIFDGEEQTANLNYHTSGFGVFDQPDAGGFGMIPEDASGNTIEIVIGRTTGGSTPEGTFELELKCLTIDDVGSEMPACN
jgi:hypothetical protein